MSAFGGKADCLSTFPILTLQRADHRLAKLTRSAITLIT